MTKIEKAVIAVAGSGTRFLPATKAQPKEMLPIVDKPIIQYLVEELVEAGIKEIILVTRWDKKPLEDHFDRSWAFEQELERSKKFELLERIKKISEMANFVYVRQKGPYGNGTPVLSAASLVKNEPFIYAWGDDLVKSEVSFAKQMVQEYERTGNLMIGVQEVPKETVNRYGVVKLRKGTMEIEDIVEKPAIHEAPSNLADFGRMIFDQEIIDILSKTALGKGNELWAVDAIRTYVQRGGTFLAKEVENGKWLTTGDPLNYLRATVEYAREREDIGEDFKAYLRSLSL